MNRLRPYGALILAAAVWGVATAVGKYAVESLGAFTTLFIEVGTAAVVLWVVMLWVRPHRTVPLRHFALLGLIEPLGAYGAYDLGLQRTGAADAALLDGLQTPMVLLMGLVFAKQAISRRSAVGALIATVGAVLLAGAHLTLTGGVGDGLIVVACLCAAGSVVVVSVLAPDTSSLELTAYQFGFGFLFTIPIIAYQWASGNESIPRSAQLPQVCAAVGIGLVGMSLAYLAYNWAVARVAVGVAGMALNLIPLFGVAAAVLWLGERLSGLKWTGGALIILGIALFPYDAATPAAAEPLPPLPAPTPPRDHATGDPAEVGTTVAHRSDPYEPARFLAEDGARAVESPGGRLPSAGRSDRQIRSAKHPEGRPCEWYLQSPGDREEVRVRPSTMDGRGE